MQPMTITASDLLTACSTLLNLSNTDSPILRVDQVSMCFGKVEAVSQVSFSVQAGSIFGFVGSDGAGKTTLLRMIAATIWPD